MRATQLENTDSRGGGGDTGVSYLIKNPHKLTRAR